MGMNRTFKPAVAALILAVGFAGSVAAGPFEDAIVALDKSDYTTALRLLRPLAEQGNAKQIQCGRARGSPFLSWCTRSARSP
jgi:hypothetical protein